MKFIDKLINENLSDFIGALCDAIVVVVLHIPLLCIHVILGNWHVLDEYFGLNDND